MHVAHSPFPSYGRWIEREAQLASVSSQAHAALPSGAFLADGGRVKASLCHSQPRQTWPGREVCRDKNIGMPFRARWDGSGLLAGWRGLFGRQESSHLPGGWGGGRKLCVLQHVVVAPALWTSGACDIGSGANAGWGWWQHHPKVKWGPRHWDWGAEPFQKRQLKVRSVAGLLCGSPSGMSYWVWKSGRLAAAAGMGKEDSWHHSQDERPDSWLLASACPGKEWGPGRGVAGRGGPHSRPPPPTPAPRSGAAWLPAGVT